MTLQHRSTLVMVMIFIFTNVLLAQKQYGGVPTLFTSQHQKSSKAIPAKGIDLRSFTQNFKSRSAEQPENLIASPTILRNKKLIDRANNFISTEAQKTFYQKITIGNAEAYLRLEDFDLPDGATLFIINDTGEKKAYKGAYTNKNNLPTKNFMVGPIEGDFIIEYNHPKSIQAEEIPFRIADVLIGANETGFDASFECMRSVNCEEGAPFSDYKRGIVRIRVVGEEGVVLCSGSLINNTEGDQVPYVLSAYHCERPAGLTFTPYHDLWYFDFRYEAASCLRAIDAPEYVSVQGAQKLAEYADTDMLLVKIANDIPESANAYFNGWNVQSDYFPDSSAMIHHPVGDLKKISVDHDVTTLDEDVRNWDNGFSSPANSHIIAEFDNSAYQPGSSGAPLLDYDGRIVGQLHGGPRTNESCDIAIGYFGRLSVSWEGGGTPSTRLKDWLDPNNSGQTQVSGLDSEAKFNLVDYSGRVQTSAGKPIANVKVYLEGDKNQEVYTGSDGRFVFNNLNRKGDFRLKFVKNNDAPNGLTTLDLAQIKNHILGKRTISDPFLLRAADVSNDGSVSNLDLIIISNVILGKVDHFPNTDSWNFDATPLRVSGALLDGDNAEDNLIIGYKMGDVDNSANPTE